MLCPIHKTPMTQLLTSWACDICQPPGSIAGIDPTARKNQRLQDSLRELTKKVLEMPPPPPPGFGPSHAPGPAPTVTCSDGYNWKLWTHDKSAFRIPAHYNLYYFDHTVPGKVDNVKITASLVYRLNGIQAAQFGAKAFGRLTVMKDKLTSNSFSNMGIETDLYQNMHAASCYALYDFNRGTEQLVFFWAR